MRFEIQEAPYYPSGPARASGRVPFQHVLQPIPVLRKTSTADERR